MTVEPTLTAPTLSECVVLTNSERSQIAEILSRRANDIASFKYDLEQDTGKKLNGFPGSVEMALSREIARLRRLEGLVKLPAAAEQDEE